MFLLFLDRVAVARGKDTVDDPGVGLRGFVDTTTEQMSSFLLNGAGTTIEGLEFHPPGHKNAQQVIMGAKTTDPASLQYIRKVFLRIGQETISLRAHDLGIISPDVTPLGGFQECVVQLRDCLL